MSVVDLLRMKFIRHSGQATSRTRIALRHTINDFYVAPIFHARSESSGARLSVCFMLGATGPVRIYVGDDVAIQGKIRIESSSCRTCDHPTLRVGKHAAIGDGVTFSVKQEIVIEDEVHIEDGRTIADNDCESFAVEIAHREDAAGTC
jgi:acetyltransferase-like isoleucine patch superfamily enzyme